MFVLDENMDDELIDALARRRIRAQKISKGVGRSGMTDEDVIPLLRRMRSVTLFTRDKDYNHPHLCHVRYCLVSLQISRLETTEKIRQFLRHPAFRTWAQRRGKLVWVRP